MLSKYGPSLVSNPRDDMSRFLIEFTNLVSEDCGMAMIHDDMTLARLMVFAHSIEESKLGIITRNLKISCSTYETQPMFKKKVATQEERMGANVKCDKGCGSKITSLHVLLV